MLPAAVAALLSVAAPAAASPRALAPSVVLPGDATASAVRADPATWLVGARPSARAAAVARRFGARAVVSGAWSVDRANARPLAAALRARGALTYAEPNRRTSLRQTASRAVANDPLSALDPWRDRAVDPALAPPAVTPQSPLLALVDAKADLTHPEFAAGNLTSLRAAGAANAVTNIHGTATAAVAGAPQNGLGIVGVWPGMRELNVPVPEDILCDDSARGIVKAISAGAAVINMSYGSGLPCRTEYLALQYATLRGITLVAAGGNEKDQGNPYEFPASLPHVLTVGALAADDTPAFFSNSNAAIDLAAPGTDILTAVPVALDTEDDVRDGYQVLDGTSFSAPMVAAAVAWVRQARPDLTVDQVAQVVRLSARDVGDRGYDEGTGFGALDVRAALAKAPPPADPKEPNEDIPFVNGSVFGNAARAIWSGRSQASLTALLDLYEDPADVYRLRVPAGRRVVVSIKPRFGNPDLELYTSAARSTAQTSHRAARSRHSGTRRDSVRWRNRGRRSHTVYVRVYVRGDQRTIDAGYTLTARRR